MEKASENDGLEINETKTKYMINTRNKVRFRGTENLKTDNYEFLRVNLFSYLGVLVTEIREMKSEMKIRITVQNRCFRVFIELLKPIVVSRKKQQSIYQKITDLQ